VLLLGVDYYLERVGYAESWKEVVSVYGSRDEGS